MMRLLYFIKLIIITNGYVYDNELCYPNNWMVVEGDSWSFDNESCSVTNNNNSRRNMAMLVYKQWPFVTYAQNTSYRFQMEYNFTIIAKERSTASVGVLWYPDSEVNHYIGLKFGANEAFSGYGHRISSWYNYDNWGLSNEGNYSWKNFGALPFTLSTNTFYSMYISIGYIEFESIWTYMRVNDQAVLGYSSYAEPFGNIRNKTNYTNTSWIGLMNTYCTVKSHSLSVLEPEIIDDGQYIIQRLKSWGAWQTTTETPITSETSTFATNTSSSSSSSTTSRTENEAEVEDLESTYSATELPVSTVFDFWGLNINMTILWLLMAAIIGCLCCCCLTIIYLQFMPKKVAKKKIVISMLSMMSNQSTKGEGAPSVVVEKEPDLERVITGEGMKRNPLCIKCNTVMNDAEMCHTKGMIYCTKCSVEYMEDSDDDSVNMQGTTRTPAAGEGVDQNTRCIACNLLMINKDGVEYCDDCRVIMLPKQMTIDGPKMTENKNNPDEDKVIMKPKETKYRSTKNEAENKNDRCVDCGAREKGKEDPETGLFHCNKCWEMYAESDSDDMYIDHEPVAETKSPRKNRVTIGIDVRTCSQCSQHKMGKCDEYGSFYCNECWKHYEDGVDTAGYIQ